MDTDPRVWEREIFLRAASLRLPRDLTIRVCGRDPEQELKDDGQPG